MLRNAEGEKHAESFFFLKSYNVFGELHGSQLYQACTPLVWENTVPRKICALLIFR